MIDLKVFPAFKGDSFLLSWGDLNEKFNLLIDAGIVGAYMFIRQGLAGISKLDGLVVTHIDFDHIGGFTLLLKDDDSKITPETVVFMNSPSLFLLPEDSDKVNFKHGIEFSDLLRRKGLFETKLHLDLYPENRLDFNGLEILILSPPKYVLDKFDSVWTAKALVQNYLQEEEKLSDKVSRKNLGLKSIEKILEESEKIYGWEADLINSSSIAFIASFRENRILFLGDANPTLLSAELERLHFSEKSPLRCNLVKISHHGSKHNTTRSLLLKIKCGSYLISTNGAGPSYHPDRETIIMLSEFGRKSREEKLMIYTNYELDLAGLITTNELKELNIELLVCTEFKFEDAP